MSFGWFQRCCKWGTVIAESLPIRIIRMSPTATLSELERASSLEDFGSCALEERPVSLPVRCAYTAATGIWEVGVALLMVVLAPFVLVLLAGSFVVACLRMQYEGEGGEPADTTTVTISESLESPVRISRQLCKRGRDISTITSYLWN